MMSMEEMFYGKKEDVWVVKPEKVEVKKGEPKPEPPPPTALETAYGAYLPFYHPPYTAPAAGPAKKETKNVELRVPICCGECNESVENALRSLKGFKKVDCDIHRQKVTVTVTTATDGDDVLLECRKAFKKARLWTKDD